MTIKNSGTIKHSITKEMAKNCFGMQLRNTRERNKRSQQWLADRIGKSRVMVANYETGKASPEPDIAVKLALSLHEDQAEYLLLSNVQRVFSPPPHTGDPHLLDVVNQLLSRTEQTAICTPAAASLGTHLSLLDFPNAFTPMTVVVGDKREEEPQNAGDLFAFSASTVDDRWLLSLGLPHDTEKLSDKVLMTAAKDLNWCKTRLGHCHILCIGSPASNLFARMYNNCFLFRFAISREAQDKWEKTHKTILDLQTQASLLKFNEDNRSDLKQKMRLFKPPGFVDFNHEYLRVGMDLSQGKDFAVVSLGQNPFAEPGAPYFSILAAGVHHPGTAHAVKFLSEPSNFKKHPFGGILEVDVPSKNVDPRDVFWYNKIEKSVAYWHTIGKESLEYTPTSFSDNLRGWLKRLPDVVTDVVLTEKEIKEHIELIDRLAVTDRNAGSPEEERADDEN